MKAKILEDIYRRLQTFDRLPFDVLSKSFCMVRTLCFETKSMFKFARKVNKYTLVAALVILCLLSGLTIIVAQQPFVSSIRSRGRLRVDRVGVYNDMNCSAVIEYLDWGTLEAGSSRNVTVYIRNEGNHVTTLFLVADNWNPVNASDYLSLEWDYDGRMIDVMETVEVLLTLRVSADVEDLQDFSFDVVIGVNV